MRTVRVVTINSWGSNGPLDRRMAVLVRQISALEPQIVTLQECREVPGGLRQAELVARAIGGEVAFGETEAGGPGGPFGNAIVTNLPIEERHDLMLPTLVGERRAALRCRLRTPYGPLSVTTAHLAYEMEHAQERERQVVALDAFARALPGPLPPILTGDLNCTPDSEVVRFLTGKCALEGRGTYWRDAFHRRHPESDGYTWSARNPFARRSVERNRRLDYVFVGPMRDDGPGAIRHARVVLDLPGLDEVYPSDHFGVFAEISLVAPEPFET